MPDAQQLTGIDNATEDSVWLSQYSAVLLKGGHSQDATAIDILYHQEHTTRYESALQKNLQKHGTGCVLSSAIAAGLSKGHSLEQCCEEAKQYINAFISSTGGLLGLHHPITQL